MAKKATPVAQFISSMPQECQFFRKIILKASVDITVMNFIMKIFYLVRLENFDNFFLCILIFGYQTDICI